MNSEPSMTMHANLRKAAVLLRSLDADTAAMMLGQLSAEEAAAIRAAMRSLGPIGSEEQASVLAELGRDRAPMTRTDTGGVELSLSSSFQNSLVAGPPSSGAIERTTRFEFLEHAPTEALVAYLGREHSQTTAVVLSHLAPARAASILAGLPQKIQAEVIDRLSRLGEMDANSVSALERELEGWAAKRDVRRAGARQRDNLAAILAAADPKSRNCILSNMKYENKAPVRGQKPPNATHGRVAPTPVVHAYRVQSSAKYEAVKKELLRDTSTSKRAANAVGSLPHFSFDDLIDFDARALAAVLREAHANVLALALAGSREELVDRICEQMPKRTAREFRRRLRRLGPTRLSDVEQAQRVVAKIAARQFSQRRQSLAPALT
jgi:flagellar motor switch protein FliG